MSVEEYRAGYLAGRQAARAGDLTPEQLAAVGAEPDALAHGPRDLRRPRGLRTDPAEYAAGWKAGRGDRQHPSAGGGTGGGIPPGRSGCRRLLPFALMLLPVLLLACWAARARRSGTGRDTGRRAAA